MTVTLDFQRVFLMEGRRGKEWQLLKSEPQSQGVRMTVTWFSTFWPCPGGREREGEEGRLQSVISKAWASD